MVFKEDKRGLSNKKCERFAIEVAIDAAEKIERDKEKKGVLFCEGTSTSMDVYLYQLIYPYLIVVPAGGCTDVRKVIPYMKKYFEYAIFGLIDRDNCPKSQIRQMEQKENVYCTKLPFIENILCCPEVLKIVTKECGINYEKVITEVRERLMHLLATKMSMMNPFNIELPRNQEIHSVFIYINTKKNTVYKRVDPSNVMYTFRDKAIVGAVADAMDMHGREAYYSLLKQQIERPHGEKILQIIARYLPVLPLDEDWREH